MISTTEATPLAAEEIHAVIYALALDLKGMSDNLRDQAEHYLQSQLDRRDMHAGDLAGAARMIGRLAAPIDALLAQLPAEEADHAA